MKSNGNKRKKINKKKVITAIVMAVIIVAIIAFSILYNKNKSFMNFCDEYIFRKNITEENSKVIQMDNSKDVGIFAYKQYILVLKDNALTAYNKYGHEEYRIDIEISTPMFIANGNYLCIAEKNGKKVYMISGQNIIWQNDIEGAISNISINQNGYCAIIVSGTTYKTTIQVYNNKGTELFKKYLSKAIAIATDISNDNKYLAVAEINYEGIVIQSTIEIIEIETASDKKEEVKTYIYNAKEDCLIININYQSKNNLICMYDSYIDYISPNYQNKKILELDETITNVDINMESSVVTVTNEKSGLLKGKSNINIIDVTSQTSNPYEIDSTAEEISICDNMLLVKQGTQILFINENGWLVKRYSSNKEVKKVAFTSQIAGIIYKDKVEIVSL